MRYLLPCVLVLAVALLPAAGEEGAVTRGEFLTLMWRDAGGFPYDVSGCPFSDVEKNDPWAQAVCWAWDQGVTKGVGGGRFAPDRFLTREECAVLLRRYDALLGRDTWLAEGVAACNDYADISPWADDSLYWACITGRMPWHENRLAPQAPVTGEEAALLLPAAAEAKDQLPPWLE